jgi:hypothetical protein
MLSSLVVIITASIVLIIKLLSVGKQLAQMS